MECPSCQHENPEGRKFCNKCGAALLEKCPNCNVELDPGSEFCGECGHNLSKPTTSSDTPTKTAEPSAPTGERRQATIVFSDLSGYTAMNEKLDPEEVEVIMSRIKAEAVKIVESHGGIVNQFVGDEVLALFGIPTAHEDDPRRAVTVALELHDMTRRLSAEMEGRVGAPIRMHTGINSGLVVTHLRDDREGRYGITGDSVNTAARLVSRADTDEILLSPDTRRLVAPFFDLEELAPVAVKGKARPMVPYRVVGASGIATRFEAAEERGFTPYTGRETELANLHGALERASSGHGQFVTVSGEAGLGKSRLLYEFSHSLDREVCTILEGRCQIFGGATPYLPLTDALGRGLGLRDDMTPGELAEMTVAKLLAIDSALEAHLPILLHLLSIPSADHPVPEALQGEALRRANQGALAAVMLAQAGRRPVVLVLEDWHWADESSDSALRYLLGLIPAHRLLVVVNYRPEYTSGWGGLEHHVHLTIAHLSANHSEIISRAVLEAQHLPEGLGELIHQRTGGNPFFIEEMCQDLLESGTLLVKDGQGALTRPAEKLELPGTVQAVIRSRLDRLAEDQREVLRLASVVGREFDHRLLVRARGHGDNDEGDDTLTPHLEQMKAQGLIQQVRMPPDAAYQFKHVLTQVVVYETLLIERRKALHEVVGRAMEELYADRLEEQYEVLAYHFTHSDKGEKAIHYMELAGDKAAGYFSLEDARSRYLEALERLDGAELTPERMKQRVDLSLKSAATSIFAPTQKQIEVLETSRRYAQELKDLGQEAEISLWLGRLHYNFGNTGREARIEFERCLKLAETLHDERLRGRSISSLGRTCFHTAEYEKGIEYLKEGISIAETGGDLIDLAFSQNMLARTYSWIGDFQACSKFSEASIKTARSIQNPERESGHFVLESLSRALKGDWQASIAAASEGEKIALRIGNNFMAGLGTITKGVSTFMTGDKEAGRRFMLEGGKWQKEHGNIGLLIWPAYVAEVSALDGDPARATEMAQKILTLAETTGQTTGNTIAQRALGIAAAQETPPDWEKVDKHMSESISLAERTGARPNLAIGYFRNAELLQKKGDLDRAQEQLDQATALFSDMEMTWWLEQADALGESLAAG